MTTIPSQTSEISTVDALWVLAMAPGQRKSIYGDYKEEIAELLEEKYR